MGIHGKHSAFQAPVLRFGPRGVKQVAREFTICSRTFRALASDVCLPVLSMVVMRGYSYDITAVGSFWSS